MSERYPWHVKISEDSSSILNWRTSTDNEVRAFSVGSTLTGHSGSLAILADDIQPDAMTAATRDSLELWLRSVLESRRDPHCPLIILQNRWSTDDIVARLLDGPDSDSFEVLNVEAICETPESDVLRRSFGESVWPERWPVDLLEKKKRAVGSHVWESSYQGHPTPEGGRLIPVHCFKDYTELPVAPEVPWNPLWHGYVSPLEYAKPDPNVFIRVTGIDTSGVQSTTNKSGSWSAWVTGVVDLRTGDIYVLSMERIRNVPFEELRDKVAAHLIAHDVDLAVIENASQGGRLEQALRRMVPTPITLVEVHQSKEARVIGALPLIEGGKVQIPAQAPWREEFLRELGDFPASKYSDITDATVHMLAHCRLAVARRRNDQFWDEQLAQLAEGGLFAR